MSDRHGITRGARRLNGAALLAGVLAGAVWIGQTIHFMFAMVVTIPRYEGVFTDFGVALPVLSRWIISMSRDFRAANLGQSFSVLWVMAAFWLIFAAAAAVFCATRRSAWPGLVYLVLGLGWWALFGVMLIVALDLPMQSMLRSLQGA